MSFRRPSELKDVGFFLFVRTDQPYYSRRNDYFPVNQTSPARSVKS